MISHMFTTENFLKSLNTENQKLDQSFSSDENDWKSNTIYHTNTYYEKNICLDTIFKENDSYLFKNKDTNYQMNSDNFSFIYYKNIFLIDLYFHFIIIFE